MDIFNDDKYQIMLYYIKGCCKSILVLDILKCFSNGITTGDDVTFCVYAEAIAETAGSIISFRKVTLYLALAN